MLQHAATREERARENGEGKRAPKSDRERVGDKVKSYGSNERQSARPRERATSAGLLTQHSLLPQIYQAKVNLKVYRDNRLGLHDKTHNHDPWYPQSDSGTLQQPGTLRHSNTATREEGKREEKVERARGNERERD